MDENAAPLRVTNQQLGINQGEAYDGPVSYDLGNMAAFAPEAPSPEALKNEATAGAACLRLATQLAQGLVAQLFLLPSEPARVGRLAQLPEPSTPLPREKPLPKPRPPTRWEAFAQRKGIQKRKRSKLEWDEGAGEWRRRFGYKRVNDQNDVAVVEAGANDQVGDDPFSEARRDKAARVRSNENRRLQNLKATAKAGGALPPTLRLAAALPEHGKGRPSKRKELKDDINAASRQAGASTASMGKFDRRVAGEKASDRPGGGPGGGGRKRKFLPLTGGEERSKVAGVVDKLLRVRSDDIVDADKAAGKLESDRRQQRFQQKLAAVQQDGGGGGKGKGKGVKGGKGGITKKGAGGLGGKKGGSGGGGLGSKKGGGDKRGGGRKGGPPSGGKGGYRKGAGPSGSLAAKGGARKPASAGKKFGSKR